MDTLHYILILLAIFIVASTVTEVFEIIARKYKSNASQMQKLEELKQRVKALEKRVG